jgi:predicted dehydrogenase
MKQINAALLSYGVSGKVFHAPFLSMHPGFKLSGAWERSKQLIAQDYPDARSYSSMEDILGDAHIDLIVVNTPTNTHFEYARQALAVGKHVVVEKAFTTTVWEAKELESLAESKGLVIAVFQNRRWDSDFSTVREVIEKGLLGDIHTAEFSFLRYRPDLGIKRHFEEPGPGAGLLNDLGPHLIDQALSLFGMPKEVYSHLRITRRLSYVDDSFDLQLYYDKLTVRLYSSMLALAPLPAYILYGTSGTFVKNRSDGQEALLKAGNKPDRADWYTEPESDYGLLFTHLDTGTESARIPSCRGNYGDFYDALYMALTIGAKSPVPASDGIQVMQIIEAARRSNEAGCRVFVN